MENTTQCVVISHILGNSPEQEVVDKIKEIYNERNTQGILKSRILEQVGIDNVNQIAVGPNYLGILLENGEVLRVTMLSKTHHAPAPSTAVTQSNSSSGGPSSLRNNAPKFRRVMLSASSRFRRGERGVVIDSRRPVIPAASVPEDLISQAQVVLQGKSRDLIVRELQRTNLNVNEAVNNLLSRDDDEEDEDGPGGEVVLPEELLSLLDPSSQHPLLEAADLYNADFEYIMGRDMVRRRAEKEKEKKSKESSGSATPTAKNRVDLDDTPEYWNGKERGVPEEVNCFTNICATSSELLAVSDKGVLYAWPWSDKKGEDQPHAVASRLLPAGDEIENIATSRLRIMVLLKSGMVSSWLDHRAVGQRVCQATEVKPVALSLGVDEVVSQLVVSNNLAVARTSSNAFFWCGLYPFNDRPKLWEKERNRSKKHVTFDTGSNEIKEGSEVRTKATPIYAVGSVAVNISGPSPMVGVLMESVWTLSEVVRFRVMTPSGFDQETPNETSEGSNKSLPLPGESRKRRSSRDVFETVPKEEVWGVCDVVWIHEQQTQDVATVKIVDGAYVALEYTPGKYDTTFASNLSGSVVSKDSPSVNVTGKMPSVRLMRKDDLTLVTPKMKCTRSPKIFLREPARFAICSSSTRKIISIVADSTGIRALTEKRGRIFITRCSIEGKILSDHLLPVFPAALYGPGGEAPSLINYGEDTFLLLRDGSGAVIPLVRDAVLGFREPVALNLPFVRHCGLYLSLSAAPASQSKLSAVTSNPRKLGIASKCDALKAAENYSPSRKLSFVTISAPALPASSVQLPSILQHVLYCNVAGVKNILDSLQEIGDSNRTKNAILNERSDSGCNIIHAAVRLSVASKNKDDADPGTTHGIRLRDDETKMAREEARDLDQRWQRLIRANRSGNEAAAREDPPPVIQAAPIQDNLTWEIHSPFSRSPGDSSSDAPQDMPPVGEDSPRAVMEPKERQKKSIEMVAAILDHPAVQPLLFQLLSHRDYGGLTPFQSAINLRAYGAATTIWKHIKSIVLPSSPAKPSQLAKEPVTIQKLVHPVGSRPDDNPLFLLCFNDTCSFTWTGEEHINQDIFECRTCGLTGTLCCCTECAFTCHRNHDCKLKRTSPTAYCDCWEKCPCKALIAGNQDKREALLKEMLNHTKLYEETNNRGEHIMLFLARTLGRQISEQSNSNKRRRHAAVTSHADPAAVPEHDLDPPKFAKFALDACINEWVVVESLVQIGVRNLENLPPSYEDVLCLNAQNGSTHLDKFVFTVLSKCGDQLVTDLVDAMIIRVNEVGDPDAELIICRFIRSILRVYLLLLLLSPSAAATSVRGKCPTQQSQPERRPFHAISMSGIFSIVRHNENSKESKQMNLSNVVIRCRNILMRLAPYSVEETARAADTLLAPVRYGILRPSVNLTLSHNQDPLEVLEKFLNNEYDLTTQLAKIDESQKEKPARKRKVSRRDTDRGEDEEETRRDDSDEDSDSDGDILSSRRHNSQSGMQDLESEGADRTTSGSTKSKRIPIFSDDDSSSTESDSDDDDDDEDPEGHVLVEDDDIIDEDEPDEDDPDQRYIENSEGDQEEQSNDEHQRNENEFPSPSYDNTSFSVEMDTQDTSAAEDTVHDEEERRDANIADPPQEEEENTRDAIHSEASSADNTGEERQPEEREEQVILRARRPRPCYARRGRHALSWTSRVRYEDSEDDIADNRDGGISIRAANHSRAPPPSQNNTGAASSPTEISRRGSTETPPSVFQTSHQLALGFSFAVRLLCDLIRKIHEPVERSPTTLPHNAETLRAVMSAVMPRLADLWNWMYVVLDRMEAQLRFGNAIMLSGAAEVRQKASKKRDSPAKKDTPAAEEHPATNSRKEAMEYFIATMRGQSREAGDDYPLVDVDTLRTLVFVFDAYLNYSETLEASKRDVCLNNRDSPFDETHFRVNNLKRFFQRSDSVCFPGAATTDAWDTLSKNGSKIPLAEKSHILTPDADLTALFAPAPNAMTWEEYSRSAKDLGVKDVLNMTLVTPIDEMEMIDGMEMEVDEDEEEEEDEETQKELLKTNETSTPQPPQGLEELSVDELRGNLKDVMQSASNNALARWKNVVQFVAKECHQELLLAYGGEINSDHLLSNVARFPVRQAMFRKSMDRYRGLQNKDIALDVHRETVLLIRDAVFQLNQTYVRRQNAPTNREEVANGSTAALGSARVKVRFHDEPGEGTGVARSFYTALAEALQTYRQFPFEELGWNTESEDYLFGSSATTVSLPVQPSSNNRNNRRRGVGNIGQSNSAILSRKRPTKRHQLSVDAEPFMVEDFAAADLRFNAGAFKSERVTEQPARSRPIVAEAVYVMVKRNRPAGAARIAGMLVNVPMSSILHCLQSTELFKQYIDDAVSLLLKVGQPADLALLSASSEERQSPQETTPHPESDEAPLFARTCRRGLFAPLPGQLSPMRINAFRNVGRIMGLALSQGELFPLKLARHVFKYILDRPIRWLDLQFFDPQMFESLRQLLNPENNDDYFDVLDLRFMVDNAFYEGVDEAKTVSLRTDGENIPVTKTNVVDYVYKITEMKLLGYDNVQCYAAIRQGISDVIPLEMLNGLSAEDMRLLLCGADEVCIATLQAVTSFSDESHAATETLDKFKQWFWSVVEGLTPLEKQELIFFWTGSPSLPTSPEALQPQPTVMVRPPDDHFLPTANTCISRLYVPLYSSKKLLRSKLQLAIKAKNFGFV